MGQYCGTYCIVQRKHGEIERVLPLTIDTGATEASAEAYRVKYIEGVYGYSSGKYTTKVELYADVQQHDRTGMPRSPSWDCTKRV